MIAKKLKKVFENKKRTSEENKTCFKKLVCYNNYMLKTISYSIVFVSKQNEQNTINSIFDIIDNIRTLRKDVLNTIFENVNDIQEQGDPLIKTYLTNGYTIKFEKPLRRMVIGYIGEITDKVEENIKKIAQTIINIIIEEKKRRYK